MKLKVKKLNFETGDVKVVVLNSNDAIKLGQKAGDRVILKEIVTENNKPLIAILDITYSNSIVNEGEVGIFLDIIKKPNEIEGKIITIKPADAPESFKYIKKKINGKKLTTEEINSIISDAVSGHLSQIELSAFITGVSINGMDNEEMTDKSAVDKALDFLVGQTALPLFITDN